MLCVREKSISVCVARVLGYLSNEMFVVSNNKRERERERNRGGGQKKERENNKDNIYICDNY